MKKLLLLLLLFIYSEAQVLATKNGYQLTNEHFQATVAFAGFLIAREVPASEYEMIKQGIIEQFNNDPAGFIQNLQQLTTQLQQFYNNPDPLQAGLFRSMFLAQAYPAMVKSMMQTGKPSYLMQLIDKYSHIIVIDQSSGLALTEPDVDGLLVFLQVLNEINGQPVQQITPQIRQQFIQTFEQQFTSLDTQTKQMLCAMAFYGPSMKQAWDMMTPQQKQQMRQQFQQQNAGNVNPNNINNLGSIFNNLGR